MNTSEDNASSCLCSFAFGDTSKYIFCNEHHQESLEEIDLLKEQIDSLKNQIIELRTEGQRLSQIAKNQ